MNKSVLPNSYIFDTAKIDSLKLRIKMTLVKIVDYKIVSTYKRFYEETGELDEIEQTPEPFVHVDRGITYRYYFKSFIGANGRPTEYLVIQLSAKMVKSDYFNGITLNNIKNIVDDINAQNVVNISLENVLQGLVSDIDICINQLIDENSLNSALAFINQFPKPSCKPLIHTIRKTNRQGKILNLGIDFNKREKATNSRPYCKIYHKGIELQTKSAIFYNSFLAPLKNSFLSNLVRYEYTIKASKHKKYLNEKNLLKSDLKTLNDLLNINPTELTNIAKDGLKNYLEPRKTFQSDNSLTPIDILIQDLICLSISKGADLDEIKNTLNKFSGQQKSRLKSKIHELYDGLKLLNPELNKELQINKEVNQFLRSIGII